MQKSKQAEKQRGIIEANKLKRKKQLKGTQKQKAMEDVTKRRKQNPQTHPKKKKLKLK